MWPPEQARRLSMLMSRDLDEYRSRAGIKRAVIDVLREIGVLSPEPKKPPPLKLVPKVLPLKLVPKIDK
jgi:hypothetical protein